MRTIVRISLVLVAGLVAGGCPHKFHDDNDVTFRLERLEPFQGGCVVRGTVVNEEDHPVRAFISWRARDGDDDVIGTAEAEVRDIPGNGRRDFESTRFREFDGDLIPCRRIARIDRDTVVTRD
jgi:hypothetical protein